MTIGLLFWIVALLTAVFGAAGFVPNANPAFRRGAWVVLFVLVLLLGWEVFGPALHR